MHGIAAKSRSLIPPSKSLLHDVDGMFDGLFALLRHGRLADKAPRSRPVRCALVMRISSPRSASESSSEN
jgi:hypothetical protein